MTPKPVAAKRTRRRPKPGPRSSLRRHLRSAPTCHPRTCNQNFSRGQKRAQQDDCRNQQYSIVALTTSTATIAERYAYSAYGEPVFATGAGVVLTDSAKESRYTYTGREWDEGLRLYHFRARMYDTGGGRFLSRDPILYLADENLFAFIASSPLFCVDPSGNIPPDSRNPRMDPISWPFLPTLGSTGGEQPESSPAPIDVLEWVLGQGCLAQCYLLGWPDEKIEEVLKGLGEDMPAEIRALFFEWLKAQPGKALLALITLAREGQKDIAALQGLGLRGKLLQWLLGNMGMDLRRRIAQLALQLVGKSGERIFTKIGTKALPVIGCLLLVKESCDLGFCNWACQDGVYNSEDSAKNFSEDVRQETERLKEYRCKCEQGQGWAPWYPKY